MEGTRCTDCHYFVGEEFKRRTAEETDGYPDLAAYASDPWLRDFIRNPGHEQHYGEKNRMPSYANKLTDQELDLLVRWLTGNYLPTEVSDYDDQSPRDAPCPRPSCRARTRCNAASRGPQRCQPSREVRERRRP